MSGRVAIFKYYSSLAFFLLKKTIAAAAMSTITSEIIATVPAVFTVGTVDVVLALAAELFAGLEEVAALDEALEVVPVDVVPALEATELVGFVGSGVVVLAEDTADEVVDEVIADVVDDTAELTSESIVTSEPIVSSFELVFPVSVP